MARRGNRGPRTSTTGRSPEGPVFLSTRPVPKSLLSASWNPANRPQGPDSGSGQASQALRQAQCRQGRGGSGAPPAWPLECTVPGTDLGTRTCTHAHTHSYLSSTLVTPEGSLVEEVGGNPSKGSLEPPECLSQWGPRTIVRKPGGQMAQHRDTPCNSFHKFS